MQSKSPGGGMVDALVSGASAARRAGSSPVLGTNQSRNSLKIKSCGISLLFLSTVCLPKFPVRTHLKIFLYAHIISASIGNYRRGDFQVDCICLNIQIFFKCFNIFFKCLAPLFCYLADSSGFLSYKSFLYGDIPGS